MSWLESLLKEEQDKIISFARTEAGNAREASKTLTKRIQDKIQLRREDVERQRDKQLRDKTKDYIRKRIKDNCTVEDCLPTEIDTRPFQISAEVRGLVVNLMNNAGFFNGCLFQHRSEENGVDVTYCDSAVVYEFAVLDLVVDF